MTTKRFSKAMLRTISVILVMITLIAQLPAISAATDDKQSTFTDDAKFVIHERSATGAIVAENVNGELVWYKQF